MNKKLTINNLQKLKGETLYEKFLIHTTREGDFDYWVEAYDRETQQRIVVRLRRYPTEVNRYEVGIHWYDKWGALLKWDNYTEYLNTLRYMDMWLLSLAMIVRTMPNS